MTQPLTNWAIKSTHLGHWALGKSQKSKKKRTGFKRADSTLMRLLTRLGRTVSESTPSRLKTVFSPNRRSKWEHAPPQSGGRHSKKRTLVKE